MMIAHLLNFTLPGSTGYGWWISLALMAISYSLYYVTFWPSISLIVQHEMIGYAYGIWNSIQNWGLFIFPLISPLFIKEEDISPDKYRNIEIILLILSFITLVSSIILWRVDKNMYRSILQLPCMKIIKQPSNSYRVI